MIAYFLGLKISNGAAGMKVSAASKKEETALQQQPCQLSMFPFRQFEPFVRKALHTLWFGSLFLFLFGATATAHNQQPQVASSAAPFAEVDRLLRLGKFNDAIAQLESMQNQSPPPQGLARELGIAYYKKSDFMNAVLNLQNALKENPNDSEAIQLTGLSLYLGGKPAEAIPYLEKVQTWYPVANVDASYILGVAYIQTKQYPQARAVFAKMYAVPAESAAAYLFCARVLLRLDFGPIAEEYATKAIALDPKLPLAHYLLGELYLYQSKIDQAISNLEQEITINPGYANGYFKLADAYIRLQKFDDAERLLERSIWLDPNSTGPYILMGKVLEKKGETELAVRALQRAISMDPGNPMAHQLLGQAYRTLGKPADAERELKQADELTRNPTKP
jgi:tetratricopeptide (TPR) repeat protein